MYNNRISIRVADRKVLEYLERIVEERKIPVSRVVNECVSKCMGSEKDQNNLENIESKIDNLIEQIKALKKQDEVILFVNQKLANDIVKSNALLFVLLQGKFNEYRYKNFDPTKFYNKNFDEVLKRFNFTEEELARIAKL